LTIEVGSHFCLKKADVKAAGLLRELREAFEHDNPDFWKKTKMGFWAGETERHLTLLRVDDSSVQVPRGGWAKLKRMLERAEVAWQFVDGTVSGTGSLGLTYRTPGEWALGPDQRSAVKALVRGRQGILLGVCASGKTEVLLSAISQIDERTLVVVHTERIMSNWVRTAAERYGIRERDVGVLHGKEKRERNLTVGMVRTVLNRLRADPKWAGTWGCVVLDEAHHAPATTFAELISAFPARFRLAATATPKRKDGKEPLFYDAFGVESVPKRGGGSTWGPRTLFEIRDADLDHYGRIVPVDVVVVPTDFWFDLNLEEYLEDEGWEREERETGAASVRRWAKQVRFSGSLNTYADMLDGIVKNDQRRARVLAYLLPEIRAGRTCLLLADRREMCLEIQAWLKRRGVDAGRLMGGRDSRDQDRTADGLEDGTLRVAVGTTVADEGMNIKRLDRGFGLTPAASNAGRLTQQTGRFKRRHPDKVDAVYFYFWDRRIRGLRGHARAILAAIQAPHRVWFSTEPGERVPLTQELLRQLEEVRK